MRGLLRAAVFYALLAVVMTWPLGARITREMPVGGDNLHLAWLLSWIAHAAVYAPHALLDGNIFYPVRHSVAFSDPNISSALLLAPVFLATGNPAVLVNVLFLASFVLCGLAAYALVRDWGGGEAGALIGGVMFAFSPLRFSHVDHVQLYAFWWTPLAVLTGDRYLREGRRSHAWLTAGLVVLEVHASLYLAAFQGTALVLLLAASAVSGRMRVSWPRLAADTSLIGGVVLVACVPLGLGYYSVSRTWGATRSLEQNVRYAASASAFLSAAPTNVLWGNTLGGFADSTAPWEKYLFPGATPVLLAIFAVLRDRREFLVRYGVVLLVVGAVFSLGPLWISTDRWAGTRLPYYVVYQLMVPARALRAPARWALLSTLGLALLGAVGAARLSRLARGAALVIGVLEAWVWPFPNQPVPSLGDAPPLYRFLAQSGRGPLIEIPLAIDWEEQLRVEPVRMYWATLHWRQLANGYSGFTPATYHELGRIAEDPSPGFLRFLAAWNLRTVVLHFDQMSSALCERWKGLIGEKGVREVFRDADSSVLELSFAVEPFVRAQAIVDDLPRMVAGRPTRLEVTLPASDDPVPLPPAEIGWHSSRARWTSAEHGVTSRWARYYCPPAIDRREPKLPVFVDPPSQEGSYVLEIRNACLDLSTPVALRSADALERSLR